MACTDETTREMPRRPKAPPRDRWVKRLAPTTVRVWNERKRIWERFEGVTVSDSAVRDWLEERWASVGRGDPNRPPDIDTATLRAWVLPEGAMTEGVDSCSGLIEGRIDQAEGLMARRITDKGDTFRAGITRLDEGSYLVKWRIQDSNGRTIREERCTHPDRRSAGACVVALATAIGEALGSTAPIFFTSGDEVRDVVDKQVELSAKRATT